MSVTDRHRADFAEHGWVNLGSRIGGARLEAIADAIDDYEGSAPVNPYGLLCNNLWLRQTACESEIRDGWLARLACELLDVDELVLFQDNLVAKLPNTRASIQWHQDYSYWPLDAPAGITLWLSIDAATNQNGCLQYIPGSHLGGERQPASFIIGAGQPPRSDLPPLDADARAAEAVHAQTRPGELIAHHPFVFHMSGPNPTRQPRRAWTMTFIRPEVRWSPEHAPHPFNHELGPASGAQVLGDQFPRFRRG